MIIRTTSHTRNLIHHPRPVDPRSRVWFPGHKRFGSPWPDFFSLLFAPLGLLLFVMPVNGQGTLADYERSNSYRSRTSQRVYRDSVVPNWFGSEDQFLWYRVRTDRDRHQYMLVDASAGERRPAFNHDKLARALAEQTSQAPRATQLELRGLSFEGDASSCFFRFADENWQFRIPDGPLTRHQPRESNAASLSLEPMERIARSRGGGDRTPIRFENRLDQKLDYFWVQADGRLQRYGEVAAGESAELSTFDGHAWLLKDESGQPRASFVASVENDWALVEDSTRKPRPSRRGRRDSNRRSSPDNKWRVETEGSQLRLVDSDGDSAQEFQLQDVTDTSSAAAHFGDRVWWSPDSSHFVVMYVEPGEHREIHMIESSPEGSIHAKLITVRYDKPGDRLDHPRPILFSQNEDWKPRVIEDSEFSNPFDLRRVEWHPSSQEFSFLYNERGHQKLRWISVDVETAEPRVVIDETSETFVCYSQKSFLHRVPAVAGDPAATDADAADSQSADPEGQTNDGDELIWMSERSGWNHLYLLDATDGRVKNPITSGPWVVRDVEEVEDDDRTLLLSVSGMDVDQDPYHKHLVRVDYSGEQLVRLTDGDGDHRWRFSPSKKYLIDTYSRVDLPPVTELRDASDGSLICELERADASSLFETGWRPPERFVAKARDGETDIHGLIIRPTNFDPEKRYPVLEHIYAGPHSSFVPKTFGLHTGLYEMAELGFIIVKMDGMGTSNRSKAFHDVCWKNLGDSGFPDRIAWIRSAASDRPEMDLERVGIWGGSAGGQSALRALLAHGDFYHAAVADCGCHDNRVDKIWWNEQWMGWPIGPHYDEQSNVTQAHRLQGDLLLIWGELDRNVDPASTMQVIDALVKADKDFDQLIMPGTGHGAAGRPYAKRRQADFFVRKLWKTEPRAAATPRN